MIGLSAWNTLAGVDLEDGGKQDFFVVVSKDSKLLSSLLRINLRVWHLGDQSYTETVCKAVETWSIWADKNECVL